jgi:hypothetical protein
MDEKRLWKKSSLLIFLKGIAFIKMLLATSGPLNKRV